jgi:hypothetical protein
MAITLLDSIASNVKGINIFRISPIGANDQTA